MVNIHDCPAVQSIACKHAWPDVPTDVQKVKLKQGAGPLCRSVRPSPSRSGTAVAERAQWGHGLSSRYLGGVKGKD